MSDVELLSRWRDGDRAAGNELFERHFRPLYRFFRTKVRAEVEDLVQETLLACVHGRDRLRSDASFRAYLFGVARRVLYKHYRGRGREDDFTQASVADMTPGAGSVIAKREDDRIILQALRSIPLEYQIAVELHDYEGLSGPEIAAVLDVPEGTIRSRIRRGRIQLRERIAELAGAPAKLATTMTRLEDWAKDVRDRVLDERED